MSTAMLQSAPLKVALFKNCQTEYENTNISYEVLMFIFFFRSIKSRVLNQILLQRD